MKKINFNKKGFTLIELLAVIVILALLVLVATPAVANIIQNSQRNSFKSEAIGMARNLETAFTEKSAKSIDSTTTSNFGNAKVYKVKIGDKYYTYLCMRLQDLVDEQYTTKNLGTGYGGYIQMWVPDSGSPITYVNVSNGRYYLQGQLSAIQNGIEPSQEPASSTAVTTPVAGTSCPTSITIPTATNVQPK